MANEFVVKNGLIVKTGTITIGDISTTGYAFPITTGTTGQVLKVDANGDLEFGASGAGTAGGSNTEIQFNNGGSLAGDPNFVWDSGTDTLTVNGAVDVDNILIDGNTISSTNTNGDVILDPNGTGQVVVPSGYSVTSNNSLTTKLYVDNAISTATTGLVSGGANVGTGADVFRDEVAGVLNFRGLNSTSNDITIAVNADNIDFTFNPANVSLSEFNDDLARVTSINTGAGLAGGPITTTGTINLDFTLATVTPAAGDLVIIQDASDSNNRKTVDLSTILTSPGGSNFQFQYNNGGVFAGDTGMTTDGAGNVNIVGSLDIDDININGNTISSTGATTNVDLNLDPKGTGVVNVNNSYITNVLDPVNPQDAATKAYVDATASGLDPKESVRVATTANVNLGVGGLLTIDGVTLSSGDRVLVKNQTDPKQNGIYIANSGAWTRSDDMNGTPTSEVSGGNYTFVESGITYAGTGWVVVWDGEVVLGTDPVVWTQFSESTSISAGAGLSGTTTLDVNVTGTNTFINGSDQVSVGHATVSQVGKFLAGAAALTDATWEYVTQLKDSAGDIAVNITGAATSTLDITTNATDVILATTGTNIDLVLSPSGTGLVVAPSGYNMSSGPASAFATKGYVDGQGFLKNVVEDTTPQLGGNLDMNGNNIVTTSNANINLIPDGTGVVSIDGIEYTKRLTGVINNNQTSALAIITYNAANYEAAFIEYVIRRSTDGSRTGTLHVINDNTNVAVSDTGAEIGDIGVTFTAAISGGNVEIRYTSTNTGNAGTIAYTIRRWNA